MRREDIIKIYKCQEQSTSYLFGLIRLAIFVGPFRFKFQSKFDHIEMIFCLHMKFLNKLAQVGFK